MENNQKKESGGWDFLFIVIVIAAIVGNLKECSKDVTRSSDISISSWFSSKAYVCAIFTYKSKDRYGNDIVEKSNLHYLVSINTSEARKYTSGRYLNESYNITGRIVSEALGVNN